MSGLKVGLHLLAEISIVLLDSVWCGFPDGCAQILIFGVWVVNKVAENACDIHVIDRQRVTREVFFVGGKARCNQINPWLKMRINCCLHLGRLVFSFAEGERTKFGQHVQIGSVAKLISLGTHQGIFRNEATNGSNVVQDNMSLTQDGAVGEFEHWDLSKGALGLIGFESLPRLTGHPVVVVLDSRLP